MLRTISIALIVSVLLGCQGKKVEVSPKKGPLPACFDECVETLEKMDGINHPHPTAVAQCRYCLDEMATGFE